MGMSHVTRMDESRHTYGWVMSHIWVRHVTRMNTSCMAHAADILYLLPTITSLPKIYVICMSASCHTHEWDVSHIWMSHVTHESGILSWLPTTTPPRKCDCSTPPTRRCRPSWCRNAWKVFCMRSVIMATQCWSSRTTAALPTSKLFRLLSPGRPSEKPAV